MDLAQSGWCLHGWMKFKLNAKREACMLLPIAIGIFVVCDVIVIWLVARLRGMNSQLSHQMQEVMQTMTVLHDQVEAMEETLTQVAADHDHDTLS